jgi:anti-anti-sigma regulatory factor
MDVEAAVRTGVSPGRATPSSARTTARRVRLIVMSGQATGRAIEVSGPRFLIGRDPGCNLRPNSPTISREHAAIERRGGRVYLSDLGTTNGTIHNGRTLKGEEAEVAHGDVLQIGPLNFTFAVEGPPAEAISQSGEMAVRQSLEAGVDALHEDTAFFMPVAAKPPAAPAVDPSLGTPHLAWELRGDVLVITIMMPELNDESTVGPVRFALTALFEKPLPRRVVISLARVARLSPRATGMLMAHSQRLERARGGMRLCQLSDDIAAALEQMPVETFATVEEAVQTPWE